MNLGTVMEGEFFFQHLDTSGLSFYCTEIKDDPEMNFLNLQLV